MIRKLIGTVAAVLIYPYPEAAMMVFLLWLYWDNLWPKALSWWEERRLDQTREALKNDLSARVDLRYVHMMTVTDKAERERKARFRQRWRSRFRSWSWWRVMTLPWVYGDRQLKVLNKWLAERISFHHAEEVEEGQITTD